MFSDFQDVVGRVSRLISSIFVVCSLFSHSASAQEMSRNDALIQFLAGQGCAIGPSTIFAARAAGFDRLDIDGLKEFARADAGTIETGEWLVLPAEICEIELPNMNNRLLISDPEFAERFAVLDDYVPEEEAGCYFSREDIEAYLTATRGWSKNTATREYLSMLGAAVISGDLAFYSEDSLALPIGFMRTTGPCAELPITPQIKRNHEILVNIFGDLIRENAENIICEEGATPLNPELLEIAKSLSNDANKNAWLGMEVMIIAMGAGWYEGLGWGQKGTPRPPLCHFRVV